MFYYARLLVYLKIFLYDKKYPSDYDVTDLNSSIFKKCMKCNGFFLSIYKYIKEFLIVQKYFVICFIVYL